MKRRGDGRKAGRGASAWSYFGLGFEIAVPVVLGLFAGHWLDRWLGTDPWLLVVGAGAGMAVGFYDLVRRVRPPGGGGSGGAAG